MEQEVKFPGLIPRGKKGILQIRVHVPFHLQAAIGKMEIIKSLKTSNEAIAEQRYHTEYAKIQESFNKHQGQPSQTANSPTSDEHYRNIQKAEFPFRVEIREAAYKDEKAFWAGDIIEPPNDEFWYHLLADATDLDAALSYCFRSRLKKKQRAAKKTLRTGDRLEFPKEMTDNQDAAALKAEIASIDDLLDETASE